MPQLLKTTINGEGKEEGEGHYHILYLRDDGSGITSFDHEHSHSVEIILPNEDNPEAIINIDKVNGHTHEPLPYIVKELVLEGKEKDIIESVVDDWHSAMDLESTSVENGNESEKFIMHSQWAQADIDKLKSEGRACETVDKIEKGIDSLTGYQRQNRTDIKYLPQEGGDAKVADILTHVSKFELDACYFPREESKVFEDATITGRGLFHDYVDFDTDFRGKIIFEKFRWNECSFFAHDKEDLSDCDGLVKDKWFGKSKILQMYPEHEDEFTPEYRSQPVVSGKSEDWHKRMLEREKKIYRRAYILANDNEGGEEFIHDADGWAEKDVNAARTIPGFVKIKRTTFTMRITKVAGYALLEDYYEEDDNDFSITPLYAKFRNNEFWGKVQKVKGLARLINRTYSQFVDILNKMSNYGWFYDSDTFRDRRAKKKWIENSAKPGFNQEVDDITKLPVKVEGVKFPVEIVNAIAQFNIDLREVMNVNMDALGPADQSGVALRQKVVQQLIGNDYLFDNLSFAKVKIGRKMVRRIQKLYSPERILRIISNISTREEVELGGQPFEDYAIEELQAMLDNADLSLYDVVVTEGAHTPSAMMGNFLMLMEMAAKGVDIPATAIIEFAPIPHKEKIKKMMADSAEAAAKQENVKYETEIAKTVINQQGKSGGGGTQNLPGGQDGPGGPGGLPVQ